MVDVPSRFCGHAFSWSGNLNVPLHQASCLTLLTPPPSLASQTQLGERIWVSAGSRPRPTHSGPVPLGPASLLWLFISLSEEVNHDTPGLCSHLPPLGPSTPSSLLSAKLIVNPSPSSRSGSLSSLTQLLPGSGLVQHLVPQTLTGPLCALLSQSTAWKSRLKTLLLRAQYTVKAAGRGMGK